MTGEADVKHLVPGLRCAEDEGTEGSPETVSSPAGDGPGAGGRSGASEVRAFTTALLAAEAPGGPGITILS